MKMLVIALVSLLSAFVLAFVVNYFDLEMDNFFQPRKEAIHRKVFENTKSYNDRMIRDLENLKLEYTKGTNDQKAALKSVILHRSVCTRTSGYLTIFNLSTTNYKRSNQ